MIVLKGKGVCPGIAFGKLAILSDEKPTVYRTKTEDVQLEISRFEEAIIKAKEELGALYTKALGEVGEENAMIFDIHLMMLSDSDYLESIRQNILKQKINAETAVAMTSDSFADMFATMEDSYMQARAADVRDISDRVIKILSGKGQKEIDSEIPVIIGALDLAPSETVQLDKTKILAFVTEKGSTNSHTAILARTMDIPAVIGAEGITDEKYNTSFNVDSLRDYYIYATEYCGSVYTGV